MKDTSKAALFGALAGTAATFSLPLMIHQQANAQETKLVEVPVPAEQYKVISLVRLEDQGPGRMDDELNKLAAQGWKVRTGVGGAVILFK